MSAGAAAALTGLAALACGCAGLAVPAAVASLGEPVAGLAGEPGLRRRAVLASALAGAVLALGIGWHPGLLVALPLVPPAVLLALVDLRLHLLPTRVIWPMLAAAAALSVLTGALCADAPAILRAAVGGAAAFGVFHALWWVRPDGMGYGDVRLSAVVGTVLGFAGWGALVVGVYAGFVLFAAAALIRAVGRRDRGVLREAAPYGPFLLVGAAAGLVAGEPVWRHLVSG